MSPHKVFISYAWENPAFKEKAWDLAVWLHERGNGSLEIEIDHRHSITPPPEGWPRWMTQQVNTSQTVLIICSPKYRDHFEGNAVTHTGGFGVTFEGQLITQQLYSAKMNNGIFFPILPDDGEGAHIPNILRAYDNGHRFPSGRENIFKLILRSNPALASSPPPAVKTLPYETTAAEIVKSVFSETLVKKEIMDNPVQITVRAFLSLSEPGKITIAEQIGVYRAEFNRLTPNDRARELFKLIKEKNLLKELWDAINAVKAFENQTNPFENKK